MGRITQKIGTILGTTDTYDYGYDTAGRLATVLKNCTPTAAYTYDGNGNRINANWPGPRGPRAKARPGPG